MPQKCRVCGETKPVRAFRKKRKGGRFDICAPCAKAQPSRHYRPRYQLMTRKVS